MSSLARVEGVVIIGSGPNGLAAAIALLLAGVPCTIYEASDRVGGGLRCEPLTMPGFVHDHCAAVHPMGVLSPFLSRLGLERFGLSWVHPPLSAAHPFLDGPAAILSPDLDTTAQGLGVDAKAYKRLVEPFLRVGPELLQDLLAPLGWPSHPLAMMRFGLKGIRSASALAQASFAGDLAKGLFAGCAAHSILPLEAPLSAALGLLFCVTGHFTAWPVVRGGSESLAQAMHAMVVALGGQVVTGQRIEDWSQLPSARAYLFNTSPKILLDVAKDKLSSSYRRKLERYRYGPGVYKVDYALSDKIPWKDPRCSDASTVHVGGTLQEISASERGMWSGDLSEHPFVMVCQQSHFDSTRAPQGAHTGYAYMHVPFGCTLDLRDCIEAQIERFAPGFRSCIQAAQVTTPSDFQRANPAFLGGTVTGGVADWRQAFARPTARLDPYRTSHPQVFIGSAASPPGGGIHGMSGYHAARSVLSALGVSSAPLAYHALADTLRAKLPAMGEV